MRNFLTFLAVCCVFLAGAGLARAQSNVGESAGFTFDTRDDTAHLAAESATFSFDTRAVDGLSGTGASGLFAFDTRSLDLTPLVVTGPTTLAAGQVGQYRCYSYPLVGPPEEVTASVTWALDGGPEGTTLSRGQLTAGVGAAAVTRIAASLLKYKGGRTSPPFIVQIERGLAVKLNEPTALPGAAQGTLFPWQIQCMATVEGASGPVTATWKWKGTPVPGASGLSFNQSRISPPGFGLLEVTVTDATNATGMGSVVVALDKAPVLNEPVRPFVVGDVEEGQWLDAEGNVMNSLDAAKAAKGIIVITHGLMLNGTQAEKDGQLLWMKQMAQRMKTNITATEGGGNVPNILLYDWTHDATASNDLSTADLDHQVVNFLRNVAPEVLGQPVTVIADWIYAKLMKPWSLLAAVKPQLRKQLANLALIYPRALTHGQFLAARLKAKFGTEVIASAKFHLIGHSAGGLLVGECARRLRLASPVFKANASAMVTLLDTPVPPANFLPQNDSAVRMERYVSSLFASGPVAAPDWDKSVVSDTESSYSGTAGSTPMILRRPITVNLIKPSARYHFFDIAPGSKNEDPVEAHSYAHEWYAGTVPITSSPNQEENGWWHSPFGGNHPWSYAPSLVFAPAGADAPEAEGNGGNGGGGGGPEFQTYGTVSAAPPSYTITEQDNAGIFCETTLPAGAKTLCFRYQFTQPGDGDFLMVSFGGNFLLTICADDEISRSEMVEVEAGLLDLSGRTGKLDFKLVSRGAANAQVVVDSIVILTELDLDGDGLSNETEVQLGTSPRLADSDGDGLEDGLEENTLLTDPLSPDSDGDGQEDAAELVAGTNPLQNGSVLRVRQVARLPDGSVQLQWSAEAGKTYRVVRSTALDRLNFEVLANNVAGVGNVATHADSEPPAGRAFYWVEVE